ncbi:MAG TPA: DUF1499 domain-containing protein [Verrucomicrobiae bacterium]|nr:DUF1499 domain-containing protein [Verrucomicrobiae bacterium]
MNDRKTLTPCPSSPNCVSTEGEGPEPAIPFTGPAAAAQERLRRAILQVPRSEIVKEEQGFIAARFRSAVFGFVDEAEFLVDEARGEIAFRSGARTGWYDFGVNRQRMLTIRSYFDAYRKP